MVLSTWTETFVLATVAGSHGNLAVLAAYADLVLQHSPAEEGNECGSSRDFEKMWSD